MKKAPALRSGGFFVLDLLNVGTRLLNKYSCEKVSCIWYRVAQRLRRHTRGLEQAKSYSLMRRIPRRKQALSLFFIRLVTRRE